MSLPIRIRLHRRADVIAEHTPAEPLTCYLAVELIRGYSKNSTLGSRLADLQELITAAEPRQPETPLQGRRALKRQVSQAEIDEMSRKYRAGVSANELMTQHHLAKRTISALLRANGVVLRSRGGNPRRSR
ncbi:hypothetical protein LV457_18650 [Mycobacterium sp. MYCO198283]|uniref:hypothetical protein n=1 Tax=Mycobacterium sp. MYCO198283 TaxID=2883505 RepID=UPI001E309B9C|nr:hypothetical protein [Mycobacterium sp. MYCO198283]MCG5434295.1 hypothetical protein [Mycobacterium sp. MYCO198283]